MNRQSLGLILKPVKCTECTARIIYLKSHANSIAQCKLSETHCEALYWKHYLLCLFLIGIFEDKAFLRVVLELHVDGLIYKDV